MTAVQLTDLPTVLLLALGIGNLVAASRLLRAAWQGAKAEEQQQ